MYFYFAAIFAAGSKKDLNTAAAAVCPGITLTNCLPDGSSIFSAEARAIYLGLSHIQLSFRNKFIILSDSLSVLEAIKNRKWKNPLISQILIYYDSLVSNRKEIIFFWIPGHIGIQGNDRADQAAKKALNDLISDMKIPLSDFKPIIFYNNKDAGKIMENGNK